ncbi:hypothetical protein [Nocardioides sp. Kera G14]|uniref:hypothetical protein n=1 Tax=Nocardioides sp. Kera G14 TaxID=2884264 RepID=UPI001D0FF9D5|nr:hypothetical protein [Nocardioides sp. Kera G14]UDY23769.1 hypothetical protein LH076_00280 [Nocardioides sp. Kera G14]
MNGSALKLGLALAAVTLATAACGGSDSSKADTGPYAATASPAAGTSMTKAPADFHEIHGEGFTIWAPAGFQEERKKSSNGEPMLTLQAPSSEKAIPQQVGVIRDVNPDAAADEQSFTLESVQSIGGEKAVRTEVPAPTGQRAFLVTWTQSRPSAAGSTATVDTTYWQLMWQVDKDLILNVVAVAPSADWATSDVSRILRSFTVDEGSHA